MNIEFFCILRNIDLMISLLGNTHIGVYRAYVEDSKNQSSS